MRVVVICTYAVSCAPVHNDAQDDRRERRKLMGMEYRSREWSCEVFYFACTFCTLCPVFGCLCGILTVRGAWYIAIRDNGEWVDIL